MTSHSVLSPQVQQAIQAELEQYPNRRAGCIEALKIVQGEKGWISDESLQALAEFLHLPVAELEGIATFYNLLYRKPVGRHVIQLCDSVSCWIMGYHAIYEQLKSELGIAFGQTSTDGAFTLLPNPCLGACERAPVMLIDGTLHSNLQPDALAEILQSYRKD
jgi:NADH-quinone oxidoreductase subunit E